ncbi:MAG: hypothetical protein FJZ92_04825 [Chloroflexi bacterium]|nr:hypothetical protein [Chloroflexota bacterium]
MAIRIFDPTADAPETGNRPAPRLARLDGLRIGLFTNSKVNADLLLRETAALFAERHGCTVVAKEGKPNASHIAGPQVLERLAANVDFMITAVGD